MKRTTAVHTRTGRRRPSARHRLRAIFVITALLMSAGFVPAKADPLVCLTIYYRLFGGPPQYIANNLCYIPTSWEPLTGSLGCEGVAPIFEVCDDSHVSGP